MRAAPYVAVYLAAIVAANWSIARWGPEAAVYNAFVLIGLDLVCRDRIHDYWGRTKRKLWTRMGLLVAAGSLLSWAVADAPARIAIASAVAFACAFTLDALIYQAARRRPWLERSNLSNLGGAGMDSVVFQSAAFGFAWPFVFAQFTAKVAGGLAWSLVLSKVRR